VIHKGGARRLKVVMAGRSDSFVPYLEAALAERVDVVGHVDAELSQVQRLVTALVTFRPSRRAWVERFFKSQLAISFRSANARRALARVDAPFDVIFQAHALFELRDPRVVLYVDCTHHQSAEQWPDWNPLRGNALERWYSRERRQYQGASHVFTFSHETRDVLVDDYAVDPDKVTVVGAGLNFDHVPDPPLRPRQGAGSPTVLFVGNDFVRKGGERLLEAFRLVRQDVPDARLRIVGTPHPIAPQPGVEVIGRVESRDEMASLYAGADVFCLPSTFEPYGFVLLEAMAYQLPCVATTSCGIPEIIVDGVTGIMVPREQPAATQDTPTGTEVRTEQGGEVSVSALAAALTDLLTDPERATRMGSAGRARVLDSLQWTDTVSRMSPVLATLTGVAEAVPEELRTDD